MSSTGEWPNNLKPAEKQGDAATADFFTELSRGLDKFLWFLEAHLQEVA